MPDEHPANTRLLAILIAGFTLLIVLLAGSGYVALSAMKALETETVGLVQREQATIHLIDEVQSEEGNLSAVFYAMATGRGANRAAMEARLEELEIALHKTTDAGSKSGPTLSWSQIREAADGFIKEGRAALRSNGRPNNAFYLYHQDLIDKVAELASADFAADSAAERREAERAASGFNYAIALLAGALLVAVGSAIVTVITVKRMVDRLRWQTKELAELSSRNLAEQEESARKFSRELHDHFGQTLTAIEANLVSMQNQQKYSQVRMDDCLGLLKDAMQNVREVSQLLRPTILDDFGLSASLRWLAEGFAERTGTQVETHIEFEGRLNGEQETQLFRIAQEALTNVGRHAQATHVVLRLVRNQANLSLSVSDNGRGMGIRNQTGRLGLVGMRERARTVGATISIYSAPGSGVNIVVELPLIESSDAAKNPYLVS